MLQDGNGDVWWRCASSDTSVDMIAVTRYNVMHDVVVCSDECKCQCRIQSRAVKQPAEVPERCHAPNTFGTVNMEHTIDSSLSWSER